MLNIKAANERIEIEAQGSGAEVLTELARILRQIIDGIAQSSGQSEYQVMEAFTMVYKKLAPEKEHQ